MKTKYIVFAASIVLATSSLTGLSTVSASSNEAQTETTSTVEKAITIDPFYNTSSIIMGKAPDAVKVDLSVEGNVLASTFVTSMFFFSTANLGINTPGTVFELTAYNTFGKVMETTSFTTQMDASLKAPTINKYSQGSPFIHGKMPENYVAAVLFLDGEKVSETFIASGQFTFFDTNKLNITKGQKIEVAGMVSNGVLGPKATIIVE